MLPVSGISSAVGLRDLASSALRSPLEKWSLVMATFATSLIASCRANEGLDSISPCSARRFWIPPSTSPNKRGCFPIAAWIGDAPSSLTPLLYAATLSARASCISSAPQTPWAATTAVMMVLRMPPLRSATPFCHGACTAMWWSMKVWELAHFSISQLMNSRPWSQTKTLGGPKVASHLCVAWSAACATKNFCSFTSSISSKSMWTWSPMSRGMGKEAGLLAFGGQCSWHREHFNCCKNGFCRSTSNGKGTSQTLSRTMSSVLMQAQNSGPHIGRDCDLLAFSFFRFINIRAIIIASKVWKSSTFEGKFLLRILSSIQRKNFPTCKIWLKLFLESPYHGACQGLGINARMSSNSSPTNHRSVNMIALANPSIQFLADLWARRCNSGRLLVEHAFQAAQVELAPVKVWNIDFHFLQKLLHQRFNPWFAGSGVKCNASQHSSAI